MGAIQTNTDLLQTAGVILGLILSVAWHESAHAWTAWKLGDPTGKLLGRITLNPIPHIDLFGTILLPVALYLVSHGKFTFGYAKPVPYDPRYLKKPLLGSALISAAGPLSNLILAVVAVFALVYLGRHTDLGDTVGFRVLASFAGLNVVLAVFNLVPIPPLDGSGIVAMFLPAGAREAYLRIGAFGFLIVMVLLQVPDFARALDRVEGWVILNLIDVARAVLG